jgi:DivIVA domain-containing protein
MMTDDAFHLTPHDVRAQEFAREMRGYARAQVDEFRERVAAELDRVLRERAQFEERVRGMQEQLAAFRERERAMNEALIAAQQLRADARAHMDREAEVVLREARAEAQAIVERAKVEERLARQRADAAAKQAAAYVQGFRAFVERHLGEIRLLEGHADAGLGFAAGTNGDGQG